MGSQTMVVDFSDFKSWRDGCGSLDTSWHVMSNSHPMMNMFWNEKGDKTAYINNLHAGKSVENFDIYVNWCWGDNFINESDQIQIQ